MQHICVQLQLYMQYRIEFVQIWRSNYCSSCSESYNLLIILNYMKICWIWMHSNYELHCMWTDKYNKKNFDVIGRLIVADSTGTHKVMLASIWSPMQTNSGILYALDTVLHFLDTFNPKEIFNTNMDKQSYVLLSVGWHYLFIPKLQCLHHWVWELISIFIPHYRGDVITYLWGDQSYSMVIKRDPGPRLNIKTVLSTYGDFHVKDKTAVRTSYL